MKWSIIFLCFVVMSCHHETKEEVVIDPKPQAEKITFILGDDKDENNPFYQKTEMYYRHHPLNKTERVITHCQSLVEVQEYLANNTNDKPWNLINLVSHGNQYLGLRVKIEPEGKRASPKRILEAINNGTLKTLSKEVINEETTIALHGCGLGNNQELVDAIGMAFSTKDTRPKLIASNNFEYYVSNEINELNVTKFQAGFWTLYYKMGYKPSNRVIERRLSKKYPEVSIDWAEALSKKEATQANDVFHYEFNVPVKWVFRYETNDKLPDLDSKKEVLEWVSNHTTIMADLKKLDIEPEKFNWWLREIYVKNEDGTKSPAVWVKGYCTILCVLKLLPESETL